MRPFTRAVFEREGKAIVGPRWTEEQVRQAYGKADDLMDYILEYKAFKPVQKMGLDKIHPGFADGIEARVAKNLPDEAVQYLSLNVLSKLLDRGVSVLRCAASLYKDSPDIFKNVYASSRQAFLKDRFFLQKVPVYSFLPFKTGDNPALIRDEEFSQKCVGLYDFIQEPYVKANVPLNYVIWLDSSVGDKFSCETSWLQGCAAYLNQKKLGTKNISTSIITTRKQHTL